MSTINIDLAADTILNVMIGQQDENEVREVVFDFSGWYTTYGSGTISLAIQRPKDEWPYEGTLTVDSTNHKATWEISETDTAYAGTGQIQLSYKVGDAKKKSVVYRFTCHKSLGALGSVVTPVQIQTFIDEVEEELQTMDGKLDDMEDEIADVKADLAELQEEIEGGGSGSGLTTLQQEWLITALSGMLVNPSKAEDVEDAIQNLEESFRNQVNKLTLNKNTLSLSGESQEQLVAIVDPSTATIIWTTSDASIATVSNGLVTSVGNGSCVITATSGNRTARCVVIVSGIYETYRVINSLTNVSSSNQATSIVYGSSYQATLTPDSGYSISSVSVLMGNVDITSSAYADGVISINNVDGEIIITATAVSTIIASNRETVDGKENLRINTYTTTWVFVHGMSTQEQKTAFSGAVVDRVELYFKQTGTYDVTIGAGDVSTFGNSSFSFSNSEVHHMTVSEEGFQIIELNDGNGLSIGENQTLAVQTSAKSLGYLTCSGTTGIGVNGYITVEEANGMIANVPDQWQTGKGEFSSAFALYGTIYRK